MSFIEVLSSEIRITSRIVMETLGGIKRSGWMNLIIIITMASILSIFGTLFAFVTEIDLFAKNIGGSMVISVYAKPEANLQDLVATIKNEANVEKVELVSKDRAWEEMRETYQVPDIPNPLPDTLHVKMSHQQFLEPMILKLQRMDDVEHVFFAQSFLRKLEEFAKATSFVGLVVSIFLGTLTVFIISNTIHLLIEARSREIEILRMMGIGNWFIRLPFLFQGAFYGLAGAIIAAVPLNIAEHYINEFYQYFQFTTYGYSQNFVMMIMLLLGILVGAMGAIFSVHRYLKI